jgi:mannosyltransferase
VMAIKRPRPGERATLAVVGALAALPVIIAWVSSHAHPAFTGRYLTLVLGPLLLAVAGAAARVGPIGVVAVLVAAVLWYPLPYNGVLSHKTNSQLWSAHVAPHVRPGDLVVATQPETVPALAYYLPAGIRYFTELGPVRDTGVVDWRDGEKRLKAGSEGSHLRAEIKAQPLGTRIVLAAPDTRHGGWYAPWTHTVKLTTRHWRRLMNASPLLRRVRSLPFYWRGKRSTMEGDLYVRVRAGT